MRTPSPAIRARLGVSISGEPNAPTSWYPWSSVKTTTKFGSLSAALAATLDRHAVTTTRHPSRIRTVSRRTIICCPLKASRSSKDSRGRIIRRLDSIVKRWRQIVQPADGGRSPTSASPSRLVMDESVILPAIHRRNSSRERSSM